MNDPNPTASAPLAFEVFLFDQGRFVGSRVFAGARQVSIGRGRDATMRLEDPLVSGRHAILFVKDGRLHVGDDGSSNGLYVNGRLVTSQPVGPLDDIRLGDSRIKVEIIGGDGAVAEAPAPEKTQAGLQLPSSLPSAPDVDRASPAAAPILQRTPGPATSTRTPGPPPLRTPPAPLGAHPPAPPAPASSVPPPAAPSRGASAATSTPATKGTPGSKGAPLTKDQAAPPIPRGAAAPAVSDAEPTTEVSIPYPPKPEPTSGIGAMLRETHEALSKSEPARPAAPEVKAPPPAATDDSDQALPYPPSPPEVDEEAEEERNFVEPFSLLESLVLDTGDAGSAGAPMVEILRYRGDRLIEAGRVDPRQTYEVHRGEDAVRWRMLQMLRNGKVRLFFLEGDQGNLVVGGRRASLASFADDAHLFHKKRRVFAVDLDDGDRAQIWIDGAGYYVRRVRAPRPPPKKFDVAFGKDERRYAFAGVAGIVAMLGGIWIQALIAPPELLVMEEAAQFAEISLKDLEMEKPPEPPKPPEPVAEVQAPTPEPEPVQPQPKAPAPPKQQRAARPSRGAPAAQAAAAAPASAADDALAALAGIVPQGDTKLSAAVSNIAAVRAPAGTSSSFAVSGAIGKVPGDEVTLSRGGKAGSGTGRETRAATAVLAGTSAGKVAGGGGTGRVRGVVARQPARSVGTTGGSLSREAILKVINEGIAQVQSCYERQLISDPGLQGKIEFEWVISPQGSVSSTRVKSSSLPSPAVANCIAGVIKAWQFPTPSGGSVSVVYPFIFSSQGF